MKQMQVPESMIVLVDFEDKNIPAAAREFKPVMYHDGESYCCLLGEDPQVGIFGCGSTREQALEDWDKPFNERISNNPPGDELVGEISDLRSHAKNDF